MRKAKYSVLLILCFFALTACTAALQQAWDGKTDDEKARIVVSGLQKTLDQKFTEAKGLVAVNPQYQDLWKKEIVPAFDKANKTLKSFSELAQTGKLEPAAVYVRYKPDIDALMLSLIKIGMKEGK